MAARKRKASEGGFPLRKSLIWLLIGTPVLIVLVVAGLWLFGSSALDVELEKLRAEGQPTTGAEINDFYVVPAGVNDTTKLWVAAIEGVDAADLSTRGKTLPIIGRGPTPIPPPGDEWPEQDASRTLLTELDPELQAIWKAAEAGGQARYPVDFSAGVNTLLPHAQSTREVARLLALDAFVAAHDKDTARALKDLKAIFAVSDSLRGEPCIISHLVRIAIHAIGRNHAAALLPYCEWSDSELQSLQDAMKSAEFKPEFRNSMSGERAMCLASIDSLSIGPFRNSNKRETIRLFEKSLDSLDGTWSESLIQQREVSAELKAMATSWLSRMRMMGVLMLMPAHEQATIAAARADAGQRTAIVAIAAQRHRLQHGQLPSSLAEIDPELLGPDRSTLLTDPFNGKPLNLTKDESHVYIYSVSENEQDDGGNIAPDAPRGVRDEGFKLPR